MTDIARHFSPQSFPFRIGIIFLLMLATSLSAAKIERGLPVAIEAPDLDAIMPEKFGGWRRIGLSRAVLPAEAELGPGEATAYRAYQDSAGRTVTLVVAYGPPLGDSVRLHRPENCYVAQGFAIRDRFVDRLSAGDSDIPVVRLATENSIRNEAVSYWLRDGDAYVASASGHGLLDLRRGGDGSADGALVRVSSSGEGDTAFALHNRFMSDFANALAPEARRLLLTVSNNEGVDS